MRFNIIEKDNYIIIEDVNDFEIKHIFDCGQCFRWNEEDDGSYTGVAFNKVINIKKEGLNVIISNTNKEDFYNIWYEYLDLGRDYKNIKGILSADEILAKSIEFGHGIRILKQDVWEIIISFIISANNRIPMIKRAIEKLSEKYGEYIGKYNNKMYYAFPTAEALSKLTEEELRGCSTGFRAKYILAAAKRVNEDKELLNNLKNLEIENMRNELMKFSGIGPKVSDCIMLFSLNVENAFPIDVWVKRVMEYFYLEEGTSFKNIQLYANDKFGKHAGFAQQYLFYYARELGIGKKK